jgi:hypothetical protein
MLLWKTSKVRMKKARHAVGSRKPQPTCSDRTSLFAGMAIPHLLGTGLFQTSAGLCTFLALQWWVSYRICLTHYLGCAACTGFAVAWLMHRCDSALQGGGVHIEC